MEVVRKEGTAILYDGTNSADILDSIVTLLTPYDNPVWTIEDEDGNGVVFKNVRWEMDFVYERIAPGTYVLINTRQAQIESYTAAQLANWYTVI